MKYQVDYLQGRVGGAFQPAVEQQTYSGMLVKLIVLSGPVAASVGSTQCQFPVKIVLPQGFPAQPPKIYMVPDAMSRVERTTYMLSGGEVNLGSVLKWEYNPNPAYQQNNTTLVFFTYSLSTILCIICRKNSQLSRPSRATHLPLILAPILLLWPWEEQEQQLQRTPACRARCMSTTLRDIRTRELAGPRDTIRSQGQGRPLWLEPWVQER